MAVGGWVVFRRRGSRQLEALAAADGVDVAELLREVSEFRLALDVDLTMAAAAAAAAGEEGLGPVGLPTELTWLAATSGQHGTAALRQRVPGRMGPGRAGGRAPVRRRRPGALVPTVPLVSLVAVAVVLGLGGGTFASHLGDTPEGRHDTANSSLTTLSSAVGQGNAGAATAAGQRLQADLEGLISRASRDPAAARDAATLLLAEKTVLTQLSGSEGVTLRATMATQGAELQRVSGRSLASLATLDQGTASSGPATATATATPAALTPAQLVLPTPPGSLLFNRPPPSPRPPLAAVIPDASPPGTRPAPRPAASTPGPLAGQPAASQPAATPPAGQSAASQPPAVAASTATKPPPSPAPLFGIPANGYDNATASPSFGP